MTNPRFIGVDATGQNFEMTAARAQQQSKDSPRVTLAAPKADIGLKSGDWLALSAREGVYDRITKTAKFAGMVTIYRDDGYVFETAALSVDLAAGTAASDQRVTASGPLGEATAEGIRLRKRGQHITLTGRAKIILSAPGGAR
ncbi:MAG: LPS export ABC transporter periplasmic protein LptC, partial [Thalassobaculaceae bacterium]